VLDQNLADDMGGNTEEAGAVLPTDLFLVDQP
jgi:hypothetical protein